MNNSEADNSSNVTHGPVTSPGRLPEEIDASGEDGQQSHEEHGGIMQYMAGFAADCSEENFDESGAKRNSKV